MLGVAAIAVRNTLVLLSLWGAPPTAVMTSNLTRFTLGVGRSCWDATARRRPGPGVARPAPGRRSSALPPARAVVRHVTRPSGWSRWPCRPAWPCSRLLSASGACPTAANQPRSPAESSSGPGLEVAADGITQERQITSLAATDWPRRAAGLGLARSPWWWSTPHLGCHGRFWAVIATIARGGGVNPGMSPMRLSAPLREAWRAVVPAADDPTPSPAAHAVGPDRRDRSGGRVQTWCWRRSRRFWSRARWDRRHRRRSGFRGGPLRADRAARRRHRHAECRGSQACRSRPHHHGADPDDHRHLRRRAPGRRGRVQTPSRASSCASASTRPRWTWTRPPRTPSSRPGRPSPRPASGRR